MRCRVCAALVVVSFGCNDYRFSKRQTSTPGAEDTGSAEDTSGDDTDPPSDDTGPPSDDTGSPSDDTGGQDACWQPEAGYVENPAARLVVNEADANVEVTFILSDTDYEDELWLDSPDDVMLVQAWTDPVGTTYEAGPYAVDTEMIFGVQVLTTGDHWQSGPATRNSDGVVHGAVTYEGNCSWLMGFEDLNGGGDLDYNDVVLRVEGPLREET